MFVCIYTCTCVAFPYLACFFLPSFFISLTCTCIHSTCAKLLPVFLQTLTASSWTCYWRRGITLTPPSPRRRRRGEPTLPCLPRQTLGRKRSEQFVCVDLYSVMFFFEGGGGGLGWVSVAVNPILLGAREFSF